MKQKPINMIGAGIAIGVAIGAGMASKQKKKNKTADSSSEDTNYRFSSLITIICHQKMKYQTSPSSGSNKKRGR